MTDVFISYKRDDKDRIQAIVRGLKATGLEVFTDYESLPPGKSWLEGLIVKVKMARCVVGCWTNNSVNSQGIFTSDNVQAEHQEGRGKLLPAILDKGCLPFSYDASQGVELMHWDGDYNDEAWRRFSSAARNLCTPRFVQHELAAAERKKSEVSDLLQAMQAAFQTSVASVHALQIENSRILGKCRALEAELSSSRSEDASEASKHAQLALTSALEALEFERATRKKLEDRVWDLEQELHETLRSQKNAESSSKVVLLPEKYAPELVIPRRGSDKTKDNAVVEEPSMEEILASIRKIISEDEPSPFRQSS